MDHDCRCGTTNMAPGQKDALLWMILIRNQGKGCMSSEIPVISLTSTHMAGIPCFRQQTLFFFLFSFPEQYLYLRCILVQTWLQLINVCKTLRLKGVMQMPNILQMQSLILFFRKTAFFVCYVFAYVVNDWLSVFTVVTCLLITTLSFFIRMSAFQSSRNVLNILYANFSPQMCKLNVFHLSQVKGLEVAEGVQIWNVHACLHSTETTGH